MAFDEVFALMFMGFILSMILVFAVIMALSD